MFAKSSAYSTGELLPSGELKAMRARWSKCVLLLVVSVFATPVCSAAHLSHLLDPAEAQRLADIEGPAPLVPLHGFQNFCEDPGRFVERIGVEVETWWDLPKMPSPAPLLPLNNFWCLPPALESPRETFDVQRRRMQDTDAWAPPTLWLPAGLRGGGERDSEHAGARVESANDAALEARAEEAAAEARAIASAGGASPFMQVVAGRDAADAARLAYLDVDTNELVAGEPSGDRTKASVGTSGQTEAVLGSLRFKRRRIHGKQALRLSIRGN